MACDNCNCQEEIAALKQRMSTLQDFVLEQLTGKGNQKIAAERPGQEGRGMPGFDPAKRVEPVKLDGTKAYVDGVKE